MTQTNVSVSSGQAVLARAFSAHRQGQLDQAEAGYREVLAHQPDQVDALHLLGLVLKAQGKPQEAETLIRRALAVQPALAAAQYNLGNLLADQGRAEEAVVCYKQAIALEPHYPEAYYGLGNALRERGDYKAAAASFGLALLEKPDYLEARHNRANVLRELGRAEESVADLHKVVQQSPNLPEGHYNLALSLFLLQRYREGAPHYAWRFKTRGFSSPERKFPQPHWNCQPAPGKVLLVYAEQGLGDTLQFVRYVWAARPLVGQIVFEVPGKLVRLVRLALGDTAQVVAQGQPLPPFDVHVPLMSLIGALDPGPAKPYLQAEPERAAHWQATLASKPGLRIGLNWQGNPDAKIDKGRSLPLRTYEPLFAVPGLRFISLQKNAGAEQLADLPAHMPVETLGDAFDSGPDAFVDAAAVLANLDLFITTDTALAHLAGGLGCRTWLLLKHVPDWRWGLSGELTIWYDTVKLFRQQTAGDWSAPIRAMVSQLESWQSGTAQ